MACEDVCLRECDSDCAWDGFEESVKPTDMQESCGECARIVPVGDNIEECTGEMDGDEMRFVTCMDCMHIRMAFSCDKGVSLGTLWADMEDELFHELTTVCIGKVKDAHARQYLIHRWKKWKGLTA